MLNRIPRRLPLLSDLLADLGHPSDQAIAKALGVSLRTVYRWKSLDKAPRAALCALFWVTGYGRAEVANEAENLARLHATTARILRQEVARLEGEVERLTRTGHFGAANDPQRPTLPLVHPPGEPTATDAPQNPTE